MSSSSNSTIFNGTSRYSADFQSIITRSVAIASLPLNQLNNQLNALNSRSSALTTLSTQFADLHTALTNFGSAGNTSTATSSNPGIANVQASATTLPGNYQLTVLDPGSHTVTLSGDALTKVTDPQTQSITSATSLTLTAGGQQFTITPSSQSLSALAQAINAAGAGVKATILNLGGSGSPDYRISLQSDALGPDSVQLNDGTSDLLDTLATGTPAQYQVNGLPATPISSTSSTVELGPGLTADLQQAGDTTITVARDSGAISNAVSAFVSAYNTVVDTLLQNHGTNTGALNGDAVIVELERTLRGLSTYQGGSGTIQTLADLGINLDRYGKLSVDQSKLDDVLASDPDGVQAFLGSADTSGFLKTASDSLTGVDDPINGILTSLQETVQERISKQNSQIADMQNRIDLMQANLVARMAAADSLVASLEQQVTYFTTLFNAANGTSNK